MLTKWTLTFIFWVMLLAMTNSRRSVPTSRYIDWLRIGVVSKAHLIPFGLFQSKLLQIYEPIELNFGFKVKRRVEGKPVIYYLIWRGDMLLKKTVVWFGFTFSSTHLDQVSNTLLYATGRSISSYSVSPRSNDPRLVRTPTSDPLKKKKNRKNQTLMLMFFQPLTRLS